MIDKNNYDISLVFLTYLAFLGDTTKVAIALRMQPEEVEVLAAKEDWAYKLEVYSARRNDPPLPKTEQEINRAVTYAQACFLRDFLTRIIAFLSRKEPKEMADLLSAKNARTGQTKLCPEPLIALIRAANLVQRMMLRALGDTVKRRDGD